MLKARGWPSLCVEHTERQDRCPQSLREGQRLAEAAWKKGPGATSSAHVLEGARAPPRAAWLRVLPAGACWGWYWRWCSSAWESSPQRRRARAKSTAAEGKEAVAWPSRAVPLVHDTNCSWQERSCLTARAPAWLRAKRHSTACCRHGEAARPARPYRTAACKHQRLKWQLRLEMDCTCFPCTRKCTILKKKLPIKKLKYTLKKW